MNLRFLRHSARAARARALAVLSILAVVAGCGTQSGSPSSAVSADTAATATPSPTSCPNSNPDALVWSAGPGGMTPSEEKAARAFVRRYNDAASCAGRMTITLDVQPADTASDYLKVQVASGKAPDVVGPLSVADRRGFGGLYLDLTDLVAAQRPDLGDFDPAVLAFFRQSFAFDWAKSLGLVSIPYTISPGFIWYDEDLFASAGLPPLPTKIGETYGGVPWDWNELRQVAEMLTVDSTGRRASDAGFDAGQIVQYGMDFGPADAVWMASCFGGGSLFERTGYPWNTAMPAVWHDAWSWYYDAVWNRHVIPSANAAAAAGPAQRVAMTAATPETIAIVANPANAASDRHHWNLAVLPSWASKTTSPMDASGFSIMTGSKHQGDAFKAMLAIQADDTLLAAFGGVPAAKSKQGAYFARSGLDAGSTDWSVIGEMARVAADPAPTSEQPWSTQVVVTSHIAAFWQRLRSTPNLKPDDELAALVLRLQQDVNAIQVDFFQ